MAYGVCFTQITRRMPYLFDWIVSSEGFYQQVFLPEDFI